MEEDLQIIIRKSKYDSLVAEIKSLNDKLIALVKDPPDDHSFIVLEVRKEQSFPNTYFTKVHNVPRKVIDPLIIKENKEIKLERELLEADKKDFQSVVDVFNKERGDYKTEINEEISKVPKIIRKFFKCQL